jgi:hypothetical protein
LSDDFNDGVASDANAETATSRQSIDEILGGGSAGSDVQPSESSRDDASETRSRDPAEWLARETARRRKADERAERLRAELDKFENAKWGFVEDGPAPSGDASLGDVPEKHSPAVNPTDFDRSFGNFATRHGHERLSALEAAVVQLSPRQQQEAREQAMNSGDPVGAVHAYVQKLGLLDAGFQPTPLADVLAGKKASQPATNDPSQIEQRLSAREQALHAAERRATLAASKSEFISEFGADTYAQIDAALGQLVQVNHPILGQLQAAASASADPYRTTAAMLMNMGAWAPAEQTQPQQQRPVVFPSNLAGARNVGRRTGPAWSGPTPLADIFDRTRKAS